MKYFLWMFLMLLIFSSVSALAPEANIVSPENNYYTNNPLVEVVCNYYDEDLDLGTLSFFGNFSGSFGLIDEVYNHSGNYNFSEIASEGVYSYYCSANDSYDISYSENQTIYVDVTSPIVNVELNDTNYSSYRSLRVGCSVLDNYKVNSVFLGVQRFGLNENYSLSKLNDTFYYKDVNLNYSGDWNFECFSYDKAGNFASKNKEITVYSGGAEMNVDPFYFSNNYPVEGEMLNVDVTVRNEGVVTSGSFQVNVYEDYLGSFNLIETLEFDSVSSFSSSSRSFSYVSKMGKVDFYIDLVGEEESIFLDEDEVFGQLKVDSWQVFYGEVDAVSILGDGEFSFNNWGNLNEVCGNIFVSDNAGVVDWPSLVAIGRDVNGEESLSDFSKIDSFLGMTEFEDSVSSVFSNSELDSFLVYNNNISDVSVVNSTGNDNFKTGILWDSSDDTDGSYGGNDREDLVFISNVNSDSSGEYGVYDYEMRVPAKLREYNDDSDNTIYLYYDLI